MKRMALFLAVLFMTLPVMAASDVTISCVKDGNEVTVSYVTDPNLIRAFGLDITVADANITKCVPVDANYRIYPGQIEIDEGEVTDYNHPYEPEDLGDVNLTIEMGSLYTFDSNYASDPCAGYGMQPGVSGTLLKFYCDDDTFNYLITENARRGGIVMENPYEEPNVNLEDCNELGPVECYAGQPDYDEWTAAGKPTCWCYPRQCHGDTDGLQGGDPFTGYYYVGSLDLGTLISAWKVLEPPFGPGITSVPGGACADFDHLLGGDPFTGYYRVGSLDLGILINSWKILESPFGPGVPGDCSPGNREP